MKTAVLRINANTHKRLKQYCEARGSLIGHTAGLAIEGFLMEQGHLLQAHPRHPVNFRKKVKRP